MASLDSGSPSYLKHISIKVDIWWVLGFASDFHSRTQISFKDPGLNSTLQAIAAGEAELAAIESKFSAEKAKAEQEHAERLRLLNEDIAAEEEGLRFEAQMDESP